MNTKTRDNKGFSLVELIIVIAIMAVLVGVLAPAYLRYVEKSRKSADIQAIDAVMRAMEVAAIDPSLNVTDGTYMKVQLVNNRPSAATDFIYSADDTNAKVGTELFATIGEYQLKSKDWKKIIIQGNVSGGQVTFEFNQDAPADKGLLDYASDLKLEYNSSITMQ